jgi:hypothetical protein
MKKLCLFTFAVLFTFSGFAQSEKGFVYLKNGTILKGKFHYTDAGKLRVESAGNIWVFDVAEIDSVVGRRSSRMAKMENLPQYSRFFYRTELGVLAGNSQNSQSAPASLTATINYQIYPQFSAGIGFGAEFLKESYLPAFLNAEYKLRNSWSSPYFFLKAGYQVPLEDSREIYYDVWPASGRSWSSASSIWPGPWPQPGYYIGELDPKGGILINPGIGYSHLFSPGFGMSLAFGYQFHRLHYKGEKDYGLYIDYNRLTVKLGFIFN